MINRLIRIKKLFLYLNSNGFTFIEVIIYSALLSVILASLINYSYVIYISNFILKDEIEDFKNK